MNNKLIKKIEKYEDSYDWEGLDKIAKAHLKNSTGEVAFKALLVDAYNSIYGQLWMDYASGKYWGNKLEHLDSMIDCLNWPRKLTDNTHYDLEYIKNLSEKTKLVSEPDKKKELFELAEYAINELLEKEPDNIKYKSEKLELLIDSYEQKVNENTALQGALDLLYEMTQNLDFSTYSTVCSAMMYCRRLKNYDEVPSLVKINEEFDKRSQTIWSSNTETLIDWCKNYCYVISSQISLSHFNNWFAVAKTIPEKLQGIENDLSKLSHDIYSISSLLEEKGFISEAEKTYLLSLEIEQLIYSNDENKYMAWRKLSFAKNLVQFYVAHNRLDEAVELIRAQLDYGSKLIGGVFEESEMHSQMRSLRIWLMELVESERTEENYQKVITHCQRRIALLKEQFKDYDIVGDKKLWRYLYYLYTEDYAEQIRYYLFLDKKKEANEILRIWFDYKAEFNKVFPDSNSHFNEIRALKQVKDFEPVYDDIDALLSKV